MSCLVCLELLSENQNQNKDNNIDTDIFHNVFRKYLQIDFSECDFLTEKDDKDRVPLCQSCQNDLFSLQTIAKQVEDLVQKLQQNLYHVVSKIIYSSQNGRKSAIQEDISEKNDDLHGYQKGSNENEDSGETCHPIRKTIIKHFQPQVKISAQLKEDRPKRKRVKKIQNRRNQRPRVYRKRSSKSVNSKSDNYLAPRPLSSSSSFDNADYSHDPSEIETDVEDVEGMSTRNSESPSARGKRGRRRNFDQAVKPLSKSSKTSHCRRKIINLGDGKFDYEGYQFTKTEDGFMCCTCSYVSKSSIRETIIYHVKTRHINFNKWVCDVCAAIFSDRRLFEKHRDRHSNNNYRLVCEICGKTFKTQKSLCNHKGRHCKQFSVDCHLCGKTMSSKGVLLHHIRAVHKKVKEYQCQVCNLKVGTLTSLKRHVRTHETLTSKQGRLRRNTAENPFDCELCDNKTFLNRQDRLLHLKSVHGQDEKNLKCDKCDKVFTDMKFLRRHMISHSDKRTFLCPIPNCNRAFKTNTYLTAHIKRHDAPKQFACDICEVKVTTKASLIFHKATVHEGKKDFSCNVCGQKFSTSHAVKRHSTTHTGVRNHTCDICGGSYNQRSTLLRHLREVHHKIRPKTPRKTASQRRAANEAKRKEKEAQDLKENNRDFKISTTSDSVLNNPIFIDSSIHNNINAQNNYNIEIEIRSAETEPSVTTTTTPAVTSAIITERSQMIKVESRAPQEIFDHPWILQPQLQQQQTTERRKILPHTVRLVSVNQPFQSIPIPTAQLVIHNPDFEIQGAAAPLQFLSTSSSSPSSSFSSIPISTLSHLPPTTTTTNYISTVSSKVPADYNNSNNG